MESILKHVKSFFSFISLLFVTNVPLIATIFSLLLAINPPVDGYD
jgi:hypothetical protein